MASSGMIFGVLLIAAFLCCCGEAPHQDAGTEQLCDRELAPFASFFIETSGINEPSAASPGLTQCTLSVHSDLELFEISLYWVGPPDAAPGFRLAHTLTATSLDGDSVAVFEGLASNYYENSELGGYFIAEDMNFDGYTDFRLMESPSAGPNTCWYFWLFDPDTGTFFRSMEYEEIRLISPEFDQNNRTIISFHRDGMGMYGREHYTLENGHPLLVRSEQTEFQGSDSLITTVTELINDEMIVTEQSVQKVN